MTFRSLFPFGIAMMTAPLAGLFATFALRAQADDEEFRPIIEADMPSGFPQYTPVREVQIKRYPAYRNAQADASAGRAFWTLFSHVKRNDIAMTAPVEMTYADRERPGEGTMAFLYGRADLGLPGRNGSVEVIDVPPMVVVSTGVRGPRTTESVAEARDRLTAWLEANKEHYSADGQLRVMAYNSPFVPRNRNYLEVEIPIRPNHPTGLSHNDN
ncbi:MAG: heme-binding protein [Planctomycetota bacterium]|jgi:hypothetical protein